LTTHEASTRTSTFSPDAALAWYRRNRERSRALFDLLADEAYYSQPIALRHPIVFYEGHLPAFSFNTLVKRALGGPSIDSQLESLFARGIDPSEFAGHHAATRTEDLWPKRETVRRFVEEADRRVIETLENADLDRPGHPLLERAEAVYAILEHEAMHQETLLYMWSRLPLGQKQRPAGYRPRTDGEVPPQKQIHVPGGTVTMGVELGSIPFGWDNEFGACTGGVQSFLIDRHATTNAAYLEFVDDGGYRNARWWRAEDWAWIQAEHVQHPLFWERDDSRWYWRGMFDVVPLPSAWPVYVSFAEAHAYARWCGARLPTEGEFLRAAYGTPEGGERFYPWGDAEPDSTRGVFDFSTWDPAAAGSHPRGRSAWGIDDLVGNGWEWTSSPFAPFPGFRSMASYPEYSADFFDGEHYVMKGASPATARELIRPSFRNWFRPRYPYVYATFRCVRDRG
jgi:ergothioneine biosynthesis protein EgtB